MTQVEVRKAINALGLVVSINDGEYKVSYSLQVWTTQGKTRAHAIERAEATCSYTNDPEDAVSTARAMAEALKARDYTF